jgi:DNA-binding transcriptional LysR family regulator
MTPKIDDMRLFAQLAEAGSLTAAARALAIPKQTLSRRLAALEEALSVQLATRTTRRLRLTEVGEAYAARCAEIARLADDANLAVQDRAETPRGTLRITADPTFGESFLPGLVAEYVRANPEVTVDAILTARRVDLIEEGFDVAFRVGRLEDSSLVARKLGAARLAYVASPTYLDERGKPEGPEDLANHECIQLVPRPGPSRWPFGGKDGLRLVSVSGRVRVNSLPLARQAALAGLGIVNLPAFACAGDIERGTLVSVLDQWVPDAGFVHVVYPGTRFLAPKLRRFIDLAVERFSANRPWEVD